MDTNDVMLGTVHFDSVTDILTSESQVILQNIADTLSEKPNLMIDLHGFSYSGSSPAINSTLAQKMASEVQNYLKVELNVANDRIRVRGLGSTDREGPSGNKGENAKIPRVEIFVRQPDAILTKFVNDVRVQPTFLRPDWLNPTTNYYLYADYKVTTGKKSSAYILYPNKSTIKMEEDALVIIHRPNLMQQDSTFIKNIKVQEGGLASMLEKSANLTDSTSSNLSPSGDTYSQNELLHVDDKLEDLIVAYQSNTKVSIDGGTPKTGNSQSLITPRDKHSGMPTEYGLGMIVGNPTAITVKKRIREIQSVDFMLGWSFPGKAIHIAADYIAHFPDWMTGSDFYPYAGIGGRFKIDTTNESGQFRLGLRIGGGIEYFRNHFGIYGEIFPVADIIPETTFGLEGGIGIRYYFEN